MPAIAISSAIRALNQKSLLAIALLLVASCGENLPSNSDFGAVEPETVETFPSREDDGFGAPEKAYASLAKLTPAYSATVPAAIDVAARDTAAAVSYMPSCATEACKVWSQFRRERPFPIQTLAVGKADNGAVLIVTEPTRGTVELEAAIADIFGPAARTERQRWMIGVDGWLGDLVVALPADVSPANPGDPLSDTVFRDRMAALAVELWGTSFGLYVENAAAPWKDAARSAPRLELNAGELESWVQGDDVRWRDPSGVEALTYAELSNRGEAGTFVSETGELAIFVIEGSAIESGSLKGRHADFRRFAVLTDAVLGAIWNEASGDMALVGRARQTSLTAVPPLRFETLEVLAAQRSESLAQSYERTLPFAGKLFHGVNSGRDWAPIYLSHDLIDTEYGALLNITDQMLKSWSSAGEVQYVYFDYPLRPKAGQFVFGGRTISSILNEETNGASTSVLFNWNTAGGAAIVSNAGWSSLTATRSGALPVTYGAELTPGKMEMGELTRRFEDQAYQYYAELGDPNLARVVSYATIYQALRANPKASRTAEDPTAPLTPSGRDLKKRAEAGIALLAGEVSTVLDRVQRREIPAEAARRMVEDDTTDLRRTTAVEDRAALEEMLDLMVEDAEAAIEEAVQFAAADLARFKAEHRGYEDNFRIASLLVDRGQLSQLMGDIDKRNASINAEIDIHNAQLFTSQSAADASAAAIERKQAALDRDADSVTAVAEGIDTLQSQLSDIFDIMGDMDAVRARFLKAHSTASRSWIRTPSIVLSWSEADQFWVGGHNLDARTLRIEEAPGVVRPEVIEQATGPVLRVPPEMAASARANANQIARMIEHGQVVDPVVLSARLAAFKPVVPRPVGQALGIRSAPDAAVAPVRGPTNASLRESHLALRDRVASDADMFVQADGGVILLSFRKGGRVECCTQVSDIWQVASYAERVNSKGGQVVATGMTEGRALALRIHLEGGGRKASFEAIGGGGGRRGGGSGSGTGNGGDGVGGGKPPSGPGGPGAGGPGSGRGNTLLVFGGKGKEKVTIRGEDPIVASVEARLPVKFEPPAPVESSAARQLANEAGFQPSSDGVVQAYSIKFRSTDPGAPAGEAFAIVEIAPGRVRAGEQLAQDAISSGTTGRSTLLDLTVEAKSIVARSQDRSALRQLMIWVKKSAKAFSLSENTTGQANRGG